MGHFDAVYAYLFFCLAFTDADLTRLFAECARVLKPDGLLAGQCAPIVTRLTARANW
jgi:SAM-dependent methyltransferase